MDQETREQVKGFLSEHRPSIEDIREREGELQAYGPMPNTNQDGWYFLCYSDEVEMKGLNCLL